MTQPMQKLTAKLDKVGRKVSSLQLEKSETLGFIFRAALHNRVQCICVIFQEAESQQKAAEATAVKLIGQIPPIEKMDASLSVLTNCE